eukprot:TRINITY_DN3082_c0_g1_i4.p1 TRINITY_DN3082_c0_g1~~TRINITY_DN3082_c0_g1_i4.p1  ORF type:complete len:554 (+),score=125.73 TRINITY_DN3082_c0_g1_i4:183-1844(+)
MTTPSPSWSRYEAEGTAAYEASHWEEAIDNFTRALDAMKSITSSNNSNGVDDDNKDNKDDDEDNDSNTEGTSHDVARLLCRRSASYYSLGVFSEALHDANLSVNLYYEIFGGGDGAGGKDHDHDDDDGAATREDKSNLGAALYQKGNTLTMLGRYEEALIAFKQAALCGVDEKMSRDLNQSWARAEVNAQALSSARRRVHTLTDDFDCVLCMKLLLEPVTTSCGHTFCRGCLVRALDHSTHCPMCRTVLHYGGSRDMPISITLKAIIEKNFPDEYKARVDEAEEDLLGGGSASSMPLFLLNTVVFPGQQFNMHIFEPRYRLMLRRCLQGSRRFGLLYADGHHPQGVTVGCTLEVKEVQTMPDGRSFIQTIGGKRFNVKEKWVLDGYLCGKVEWLDDKRPSSSSLSPSLSPSTSPPTPSSPSTTPSSPSPQRRRRHLSSSSPSPSSAPSAATLELASQLRAKLGTLAEGLNQRSASSLPPANWLKKLVEGLASLPVGDTLDDAEKLSLWVAAHTPLDSTTSLDLLASTDTDHRIRVLLGILNQDPGAAAGCTIM